MFKTVLAVLCILGLAGSALAQTTSTQTVYSGLEGSIFDGMTSQQQQQYNAAQAYFNYTTQFVTMAYFKQVEKKFERGDTLNSFESSILARGPLAISTGNQAFVTVGSP